MYLTFIVDIKRFIREYSIWRQGTNKDDLVEWYMISKDTIRMIITANYRNYMFEGKYNQLPESVKMMILPDGQVLGIFNPEPIKLQVND